MADVAQQENNGFGPLSKPRGKTAVIVSVIVVIFFVVVVVVSVSARGIKEGIFPLSAAALITLSTVIGEFVRRICLITEEIQHKETRYRGNWKQVFSSTFGFGNWQAISVASVFIALILGYTLYEHYETFCHADYAILFALNCFVVPQLVFLVGVRELSPVETSDISEKENKNVADGLAWGYYFGYLKLVLPRLEEQIGKSDKFRYHITTKKLFILLPKTCFTYDDIEHADDRVKWAGNLPECEINRGGIKARSYKHAVHRIEMPRSDGGVEKYHLVLEYATPLMNLYDMSTHADAPLSRQERDHQVISQCNCSTFPIGQPLLIFSWSIPVSERKKWSSQGSTAPTQDIHGINESWKEKVATLSTSSVLCIT